MSWKLEIMEKLEKQDENRILWIVGNYDNLKNDNYNEFLNILKKYKSALITGKPYSTMRKYDNHSLVVYDYLGKRFDSICYEGPSDEYRNRAQYEEMSRYKCGIIYDGNTSVYKTMKKIKVLVFSQFRPQWTRFSLPCWEVYGVNNGHLENILT